MENADRVLTAGFKWEDHEERCRKARIALVESSPSPRVLANPALMLEKKRLKRDYQEALKSLQDYLLERYGREPRKEPDDDTAKT